MITEDARATLHVGSWGNVGYRSDPRDEVVKFLGDFACDYDVDGLTDAYRDALNAALAGTTIEVHGRELYSGNPVPEGALDVVRAAIQSVDLGALAAQHERQVD